LEAIRKNRIKFVENALATGDVDVNCTNERKETALYLASKHGHVNMVAILLKMPQIRVNLTNHDNESPFHVSCRKGHVDLVKLFLADGRSDFNRSKSGLTPFMESCVNGHMDVVKLLLADERIDVNCKSDKGYTAYFMSCMTGNMDLILYLLKSPRVDVNIPNNYNSTPFHFACISLPASVIACMANSDHVDINRTNNRQQNSLWVSVQNGKLLSAKIILASGRQVDLNHQPDRRQMSAVGFRTKGRREQGFNLVKEYKNDREGTIKRLREEIKYEGNGFLKKSEIKPINSSTIKFEINKIKLNR